MRTFSVIPLIHKHIHPHIYLTIILCPIFSTSFPPFNLGHSTVCLLELIGFIGFRCFHIALNCFILLLSSDNSFFMVLGMVFPNI